MMRIALIPFLLAACGAAHSFCFDEAGEIYNVNPKLLRGIAQVESSMNPGALNLTHTQRTKSHDIGLMQINSGWLPTLAKRGITREALIEQPCTNVKVGAWILARTMAREGASWNGVGAYNAVCTQLKGDACTQARMTYATKVWKAMNREAGKKVPQVIAKSQATPEQEVSRIASVEIPDRGDSTVASN